MENKNELAGMCTADVLKGIFERGYSVRISLQDIGIRYGHWFEGKEAQKLFKLKGSDQIEQTLRKALEWVQWKTREP